jgi:hypothetical protein
MTVHPLDGLSSGFEEAKGERSFVSAVGGEPESVLSLISLRTG